MEIKNKNNNYLNRKTKRKLKRQDKKQKKDFFYKHQHYPEELKKYDEAIKIDKLIHNKENSKKNFHFGKNMLSTMNIKENELEDEDLDSDIPSDNEKDSVNIDNEFEDNKFVRLGGNNNNNNDLNDLDHEINKLEKKLGLKDGKKFERFKKSTANENYDEDLFEFLDNIDHIVKEKRNIITRDQPEKKVRSSGLKQQNPKVDKLSGKLKETQEKEQTENLIDIKSQSRLFSHVKLTDEEQIKLTFQKDITALINKISEANLTLMFPEFIEKLDTYELKSKLPKNKKLLEIYETITKISLKLVLDQEITNLPITSCICSYLSLLHYKYGNSFMIYLIKNAFDKLQSTFWVNSTTKDSDVTISQKSSLKNFVFLMIHFYIFQNLTSKIYFDIIKHFIENFNEVYSEMLLLLLSYIGIEIRKEDPNSIKEIISEVTKKYNYLKLNESEARSNIVSSKLKFIVEMIDDIKNNKYLKFNLSEKFTFFKTFITTNKKTLSGLSEYDTHSKKIADKMDLSLLTVKNLVNTNTSDIIFQETEITDPNTSSLQNEINLDLDPVGLDLLVDNTVLEAKLKKYKMTTNLKKMIFSAIVTATDCNDGFEKLMRLNLTKDQSREIVKILVLLSTEESSYNPFYKLLLSKLISVDKAHKYTFHYTIWDNMKLMTNDYYGEKKVHNLSRLTSELLCEEKISLPVFLTFEFEDSNRTQHNFILSAFDKYFEKSIHSDKCKLMFAKLVKNDDHVEFGKRLFNFLINNFKKEVGIENKTKEYIEKYTAATKVLKRIL